MYNQDFSGLNIQNILNNNSNLNAFRIEFKPVKQGNTYRIEFKNKDKGGFTYFPEDWLEETYIETNSGGVFDPINLTLSWSRTPPSGFWLAPGVAAIIKLD
jgi:hypothetical protein